MPPLAICSSPQCLYSLRLHDIANGLSVATPKQCPRCGAPVITACPECRFPLLSNRNPRGTCEVCQADIRVAFKKQFMPSARFLH